MATFDIIKRQKILNKSNGVCAFCGKELDLRTFTVDHYIPRSKGGADSMNNLIPLCKECNIAKGDKILKPLEAYNHINIKYENDLLELFNEYNDEQKAGDTLHIRHKLKWAAYIIAY